MFFTPFDSEDDMFLQESTLLNLSQTNIILFLHYFKWFQLAKMEYVILIFF